MFEPIVKVIDKQIRIAPSIEKIRDRVLHKFFFSNLKKEKASIEYSVPLVDFQYLWHPLADGIYSLNNEWDSPLNIKINKSLPVICLFNQSNRSRFSIAASELVGEMNLSVGVHEESASVKVIFEFLIPDDNYELTLSLVSKDKLWSQVVQCQVKWLYDFNDVTAKNVPFSAYQPVLSTWYSFHQQVSQELIYQEAVKYRKLGAETIILDDGWQTDDSQRRYAYAGDWQVSKNKFDRFQEHIGEVQSLGMKYLIWLSLPYIGIKSQRWESLKNDLLYIDEFQRAGVLDLRSNLVQETVRGIVKDFLKEFPVDGLKLDFFETFILDEENNREIAESLLKFLSDLEKIYPKEKDFLIEYRQDYINPLMMQFANIIRAKDCPNNLYLNRIRTIDLRLSCPYTAVHSDMIMWNKLESVESAALQIINVLFSVPQLSVRHDTLTIQERKMLEFWLSFIKKYHVDLLREKITPLYPQEGYTQVHLGGKKREIIVNYSENKIIEPLYESKEIIIINGTYTLRLWLKIELGNYQMQVFDCMGNMVEELNIVIGVNGENEILNLKVPIGGLLFVKSME